ncbi:hypothetical protein [Primorskyibacter flagellatus]|uniref:Uncharacterized protein n=1 Tax=Primorskyibacter flagellatus TaxID=1387277 RepID=A0A1W1Z596_9RHOB|nr:hypothetical protein [Primorskyibacter flagellatus]SMC43108.1 hypothetical protein SAMN06295998_101214 [Primorskyibacter flagellatus]
MSRNAKHRERNRRAARWLLGLSLVAALFFGVRVGLDMVYWNDPKHHEQQLEPWMTVGYVARSWVLDPRKLHEALALGPGRDRKTSLGHLARQQDIDFETYALRVMDVIARQKAATE